jgi:hypothetical protein
MDLQKDSLLIIHLINDMFIFYFVFDFDLS